MYRPQVPGRIEALRHVICHGAANTSPEMRRLAGLGKQHRPRPTDEMRGLLVIPSNSEPVDPDELAAMQF
ncbi:MAG: hypothetical protein EOP24_39515 [Hyphomicrobiales bacterium]|nr:MAG: hypothetical protein EOP24_39515 [Hyphomicrobiales bacterium]